MLKRYYCATKHSTLLDQQLLNFLIANPTPFLIARCFFISTIIATLTKINYGQLFVLKQTFIHINPSNSADLPPEVIIPIKNPEPEKTPCPNKNL